MTDARDAHNRRVDAHVAPRSTTTRRQWWLVLRAAPAIPLAASGLWNLSAGDVVVGIALILCAATVTITVLGLPAIYRMGYATGALQTLVDMRVSAPPDVLAGRVRPHPADPLPPNLWPDGRFEPSASDPDHISKKGV